MKTIILRDDDISYFTSPAMLERLYGRLWEAGVPVAFAVIPAPRGDVQVLHRATQPYDPSIPPEYRGQGQAFPLHQNLTLCEYLNEKAGEGLVEVCLHGYNHIYYEFGVDDSLTLDDKIRRGHDELRTSLPAAEISTFIAPYDVLSRVGLGLLEGRGFNLCTSTGSLSESDYATVGVFQQGTMSNGCNLFTCDEYFFNRHEAPQTCLARAEQQLAAHDLLIVTNHYWTFFYDWSPGWGAMLAAWDQFVETLLALPDARFITFADRG